MRQVNIGCIVMAAGCAMRFGTNKLKAVLDGKSLILRALEAVPRDDFGAVTVVTQYPEIRQLAQERGFTAVVNTKPELGLSHTIALGLQTMPRMDAVLFQVADQPLLKRESVAGLVAFYRRHPDDIAALGHDGARGNPCIFPAAFFPELLALRGDHGGSTVIRQHQDKLLLWEVPPQELTDVDTPETLAALRREAEK